MRSDQPQLVTVRLVLSMRLLASGYYGYLGYLCGFKITIFSKAGLLCDLNA